MKLNSIKFLLATAALLILSSAEKTFAGVPNIVYVPSVNTFSVGTAITPLNALQSGVSAYGYLAPTNFGSTYSGPEDVAIDPSGNIYVTNVTNNTIRKFNSSGTFISTFGTGLNLPYNISFDASGNAFITNNGTNSIIKITSGGVQSTFITGLNQPYGTVEDAAGNVYVANAGAGTILKYNSSGTLLLTISSTSVDDLALDASGNIYALNFTGNSVLKYNAAGVLQSTVVTGLSNPSGITIDASGNLYVVDSNNNRVLVYNPAGTLINTISTGSGTSPRGVAIDPSGIVYITCNTTNTVLKYVPTGGFFINKPLPAGLSFDSTMGTISGTPTAVSPSTVYTVYAYNASGATSTTVTITVNNPSLPAISYATPQTYTQGIAISALSPSSTGGTVVTYTAVLPAGLSISATTGVITGTPAAISAATNYTITATNAAGPSTTALNITVNAVAPAITYATPQTYIQGNAIAPLSPTSTGGLVVTYSAASLPAGLSINAITGVIMGTPTAISAAANYIITATNSGGSTTATINITVNPPLPAISYASPQVYTQGVAISTLSPTSTGGAVVTYSATLPAGLTINASTGAITGTPTTVSVATNYTVTATNVTGSGTATINITVKVGPPVISYPTPDFYAQNVAISSLSPTSTGGAVVTYTATTPLPAGLTLNLTTGVITGTPTAVSAATNYTITATNATGSSTATINITVFGPPTVPAVTQCGAGATLTASDSGPAGGTYNWYTVSTGGVAFQSSTSTTFSAISTATYYVSYTYGGVESTRTSVTATINPIVSAPYSGAYFSYPFNGNTNDVSSYGNAGSNNAATLTTDRYNTANAAYKFNGTSSYITDPFLDNNPSTYTVSIWFKTTSTTGGGLIAMVNGSYQTDRVLYMANSGQLYWGLYNGSIQTMNTAASYNDGNWHHAVVTVSSSGSFLVVDAIQQVSNASMTTGNGLNGNWCMGYANINTSGWTNPPTSNYFKGNLDDIAVYHRVLSAAEIASSNDLNQIYVGTATACTALTFNAPTITGATYTWKDPNNNTQTGQSVSFPGAVAGNYSLTVTGGPGGCSSTTTLVPVIYGSSTAAINTLASVAVTTNTTISLFSPVGSSTYTWNFGMGATPASAVGQGPFTVQWSSAGVKTITLTVVTSGGCTITATQNITVTSTPYGNYTYNRTITMNNAAVGMSANVTNFPVLLSIQSNDLIVTGTCADKIQNPNGPNYDFAFFDPSAASELFYQVESYNSTTGTLLVWVRIPTMYAATNNTLSFYYGAKVPSVTHNAAFFANTWTADYQAVYHFNETGYTGSTADGTSNGRTASLAGFSAGSYVANGKIGSCYTFGGVEDMEAAATAPSSTVTMSAWINTSNNNCDEKVITNENASGDGSGGYKLGVYFGSAETEAVYTLNRGSNTPAEPTPLSNGTWYYVQGVYDGTTMSSYVNGVQYKTYAVTATSTFTNTLYIGIGESKIYPFSGMIDEPRVSNIAKSSDWIKMEYVNQNNPTAFITVGNTVACNTTNGSAIPGEVSYTWTGATSTDPTVASNWNNSATGTSALPAFDGSATLVIPSGLSTYPALTAPISLYGLTIASGAQLNLNGNIMSVSCHIYNGSGGQILYGSTTTAGGITWNGALPTQYYYGSATGQANIANMTVNNTAAGGNVTITGGAVGINNVLTITQGNLVVNNAGSGSLTLFSTATNSASVAAIPTGYTITGNVNVQRYITSGAGSRGYRLLSSPVNASSSTSGSGIIDMTYLNANVPFGSTNYYGAFTEGPGTGFTTNGSYNPIIYLYDESRPTDNTSFVSGKNVGIYSVTGAAGSPAYGITTLNGHPAATASGVTVPVANSYLFYYVGSNQSTVVANTRIPDATTITSTGYLNQGNVPFVFWKNGSTAIPYDVTTGTTSYGLNQVGNPYASTINLNKLYSDNYSAGNPIGAAFYEFIPGGNYVTYNASNGHVSDSRASQYIVSGQGFLAQSTATSQTLTFKEDQKVAYNSSAVLLESFPSGPALADAYTLNSMPAKNSKVKTNAIIGPVTIAGDSTGLHLQLTLDSLHFAQTGVYFSSTASDKYVQGEDAKQINGGTPVVFLSSYSADSVLLSINTLGDYAQGKRIRLYTSAKASGTYTLSLANIVAMDTADYSVYLVDNLQKDSLDILHSKNYTFTINTADTTTYGPNRFVLAIGHRAVAQYVLSAFSGQKVSTGVQLNWSAVNAGNYTGYTLQKMNSDGGFDSLYAVQSDPSVTAYNYIDTHPIIGNNIYRLAQNGISGAITYSATVTVGYNSTTPAGALTLYPNPASSIINANMLSSTINNATYTVDIYNSLGSKVKTETISSATWTDDVTSYKLGIYIMQVKDKNGYVIATAKFAKVM